MTNNALLLGIGVYRPDYSWSVRVHVNNALKGEMQAFQCYAKIADGSNLLTVWDEDKDGWGVEFANVKDAQERCELLVKQVYGRRMFYNYMAEMDAEDFVRAYGILTPVTGGNGTWTVRISRVRILQDFYANYPGFNEAVSYGTLYDLMKAAIAKHAGDHARSYVKG